MSTLSVLCRIYLGLVVFSLAGSLLSRLTGLDPGLIAPIASAATIGTGFLAVFEPAWTTPNRSLIALLPLALVGAASIEICGILTGFPFGRYGYTTAWKPVILIGRHNFPLLVPFAWLLVVGASLGICSRLRHPILCGALLATAVDAVMEPVMTGPLKFWTWTPLGPLPGGAALLNPIGWLICSGLVGIAISSLTLANRRTSTVVLTGHLILISGIAAISLFAR